MASSDKLVAAYVMLRDQKKEMMDRHKAELEPINTKMALVENAMLDALNGQQAESVRTEHGTMYKLKRTSTKVVDWDVALAYILDNDLEHMLERRVSKSAVEEFLAANGELPPGVAMTTDITVGVRRPDNRG